MKKYEQFGIYDFSDFAEELETSELILVNGGSCGGGCGGGSSGGGGSSPKDPSGSTGPTSSPSSSTPSKYGQCGGFVPTSPNERSGSGYPQQKTAKEKIIESINSNQEQKYNDKGNGYKCDNWVEEVLTDAGYNSNYYLTAGKASDKSVAQHIDALIKSGKEYSTSTPTKDGAYVVFMGDGKFKDGSHADEHCTLYVVNNGVGTVWDNSSCNKLNNQGGNIAASKLSDYTPYKTFYFQEVKK